MGEAPTRNLRVTGVEKESQLSQRTKHAQPDQLVGKEQVHSKNLGRKRNKTEPGHAAKAIPRDFAIKRKNLRTTQTEHENPRE